MNDKTLGWWHKVQPVALQEPTAHYLRRVKMPCRSNRTGLNYSHCCRNLGADCRKVIGIDTMTDQRRAYIGYRLEICHRLDIIAARLEVDVGIVVLPGGGNDRPHWHRKDDAAEHHNHQPRAETLVQALC